MLKIIQIVFFVLAFNSFAYAEEIKLECKMTSQTTYSNGESESFNGTALVDIYETKSFKSISVSSDIDKLNNLNVGSIDGENYSFKDYSNNNKWDIQTTQTSNNRQMISAIKIDRNTGLIFIDVNFKMENNRFVNVKSSGNCKKIDATKKKF